MQEAKRKMGTKLWNYKLATGARAKKKRAKQVFQNLKTAVRQHRKDGLTWLDTAEELNKKGQLNGSFTTPRNAVCIS